jgi:hypothetical protein
MVEKQQFIDWLRETGNSENIVLAALLEYCVIQMPQGMRPQ